MDLTVALRNILSRRLFFSRIGTILGNPFDDSFYRPYKFTRVGNLRGQSRH